MKPLLAILCLTTTVVSVLAAVDLTEWNWQCPIDTGKFSGFVRLSIPPEIFDRSQGTLGDLRVMDEGNRFLPHVIHWGRVKETQHLDWQSARLMNATFLPGKYARVILDFGDKVEKNLITVSLSGRNYRRRALLEGSDDSRAWDVCSEDLWLFDVSLPEHHFRVSTLRFPDNNFRYFRLTVYNMTDDPKQITIETVKCALRRIETEKELVVVPVKQMTLSQDEDKRQTILDLDLGYRNLPVAGLQFGITTPYFYRGYESFGRNEPKEKIPRKRETRWDTVEREVPWQSVDRGVLYRVHHKNKITESLKTDGLHAPYRYLKIRIFDEDNPPLKIDNVTVYRRDTSLVFESQTGRRLRLIGGNPKAGEARYDLARSVKGIDGFALPVVTLGPQAPIAHKEPLRPWSERYSIVIWIVLVLAVGIMLIFLLRNLKKLPAYRDRQ